MDVLLHHEPATFLERAAEFLRADPVRSSIVASTATGWARTGVPDGPYWFATVEDRGRVVGVAMRTHPAAPHAGFAVSMAHDAGQALADALDETDQVVPAWKGDLETARLLCERAAACLGGRVEIGVHLRVFEAHHITPSRIPPGRLRRGDVSDVDLVSAWTAAFQHDADLQGGRPAGTSAQVTDRRHFLGGLTEGAYWFWEVDGRPVQMTVARPPALGVVRIGPVYTPADDRGHGYAGHVVGLLSRRVLDRGDRVCLYTDQANPVSNALYERLGYERVGDEAEFVVR